MEEYKLIKKGFDIWLKNEKQKYANVDYSLYIDFYDNEIYESLNSVLAIFHTEFNSLMGYMNSRLENRHYTAHESRELIQLIEELDKLKEVAKIHDIEIQLNENYEKVISKCNLFLENSGGSSIPKDFEKIKIIDYDKIFKVKSQLSTDIKESSLRFRLKPIGDGSYANVFKYKDEHYNKIFAIKRAKPCLRKDELERFKLEFLEMKKLKSPYILEVYNYNDKNNEYTMEYMDGTLDKYIYENNTKLQEKDRIGLVRQVLKAFKYIHSHKLLHRDISLKNVLVKKYDDVVVLKVSDFGLVKKPESDLTRKGTEIKGSLNDHKTLEILGFENFKIEHETYALTKLVYFIMTGKYTLERYHETNYKDFVSKGISDNLDKRYKNIEELELAFNRVIK